MAVVPVAVGVGAVTKRFVPLALLEMERLTVAHRPAEVAATVPMVLLAVAWSPLLAPGLAVW